MVDTTGKVYQPRDPFIPLIAHLYENNLEFALQQRSIANREDRNCLAEHEVILSRQQPNETIREHKNQREITKHMSLK